MKPLRFIWIAILVTIAMSCDKTKMVSFTGRIVDLKGNEIKSKNVTIEVNGTKGKIDGGKYTVGTKAADRYVLNIWAEGYALGSKVYTTPERDQTIILTKATTKTFDPSQPIILTDDQNACYNSVKPLKWNPDPVKNIPTVYDAQGRLIGFEMPADVRTAFEYYFGTPECNTGTTIEIDPNSLEDANGNPPPPEVTVSVSTVDLYSPDGMPGDYSIVGQQPAYMQSFGAGTVDVYGKEGKKYNLKKGARATLTIPVDPGVLKLSKEIPKEIPFFVYDRKAGQWRRDGSARFDPKRRAYVAKVSHFSEFNMDLEKDNPACAKFWIDPLVPPTSSPSATARTYSVRVILPNGVVPPLGNITVNEDNATELGGNCYIEALPTGLPATFKRSMHAIQRIPPGQPIGLAILNSANVITSISIINVADKGTCDDCGMNPADLWRPACNVGAACPTVAGCDPIDNTKAYPVCSGPAKLTGTNEKVLLAEAVCEGCNDAAAANTGFQLSWAYSFPAGATERTFWLSGGRENGTNTFNTDDHAREAVINRAASDLTFTLDYNLDAPATAPNLMCNGVASGKISVAGDLFGSFHFTCADPLEEWHFKVIATYKVGGADQRAECDPAKIIVTNNP